MTQKFTVLFDLDGTLVDTAPDLMLAHNHVMKKFGYPTKSLDELENTVGQGAGAMIGRSIWSQAKKELTSINEKIKNEMTDEFISYYGNNILKESTLMPGVKDFLNWCKKENISMAVCTNKTEHLALDLLKKIGIYDFFEYVAGHNTFDYCKPDPRHLTDVVEIMQGDISKTIMIGDSETDSDTARNARIPFILLEDGYTEKKKEQIPHNISIKNFKNFEKVIEKYL